MTTHFFIAAAWLTGCGISAAVEGISSDWTEVAAADRLLMGDYQGEWIDAPEGHYFNINKPLAAQVINLRAGEYQVPKDGHAVTQTPQAIWNLGMVTFGIGAVICHVSLLAIRRYPITRERLEQLRQS